jgi:hypothetical protein
MMNEAQDASDKAREFADRAEQASADQTEAAKKAQEAAEELQDEMEQSTVRTRNHIYLGIFVLSFIGFAWGVVRKSRGEEIMKDNEKFGISTVIGSMLIMVLALMISDEWAYRFDLLQNLMTSLRIQLFAENGCTILCKDFLVDFPTKYAVLACLCSAAYGFTTYLDITPMPKLKAKVSDKAGTA